MREKPGKLAAEIWRRLFGVPRSRKERGIRLGVAIADRGRMDCCRHTNAFRLCSGLRILGYLMLLLVAAIVGVSYYAVVVVVWGPRLLAAGRAELVVLDLAVLLLFHLLLVLLLWSYLMTVFNDPGAVPENWRPLIEEGGGVEATILASTLADHVALETRASEGSERRPVVGYCIKCQNSKPPRCHHCSVCQRCVLKMDHHCVWVVNCVGARNYKFFLLFVFYTFLETVLDTVALLPNFIKFFGDARKHTSSPGNLAITFLAFVLNLAFALSLLCFVVMHTSLVLSNTTSVEVYEKKKSVVWKYDIGKRKNFEQVFGTKKLFWFFPLFSAEDLEKIPALQGLEFPTRTDIEA